MLNIWCTLDFGYRIIFDRRMFVLDYKQLVAMKRNMIRLYAD